MHRSASTKCTDMHPLWRVRRVDAPQSLPCPNSTHADVPYGPPLASPMPHVLLSVPRLYQLANKTDIWSLAVVVSGEPMIALLFSEVPYKARSELAFDWCANLGSSLPMRVFSTLIAHQRSKTYTHTRPLGMGKETDIRESSQPCTLQEIWHPLLQIALRHGQRAVPRHACTNADGTAAEDDNPLHAAGARGNMPLPRTCLT